MGAVNGRSSHVIVTPYANIAYLCYGMYLDHAAEAVNMSISVIGLRPCQRIYLWADGFGTSLTD